MGFFIKNQQCWHNKKIGKHLSTLKSNSGWMCPTVLSSHHQKNEKSIKKELVLIQHHWKRILQVMNAFFLLLCFLWMTCAQLLLHPSFDWNIHWKVYRVEYTEEDLCQIMFKLHDFYFSTHQKTRWLVKIGICLAF